MRFRAPHLLALAGLGAATFGVVSTASAQRGGLSPAAAGDVTYSVTLDSTQVAPGPGDTGATGTATVTVNPSGQVCVDLTTAGTTDTDLSSVVLGTGLAGVAGATAVDFGDPTGTDQNGCVTSTPVIANAIIANPAAYYLTALSAAFPGGAVRGQLPSGSTAGSLYVLSTPLRAYDSRQPGAEGPLAASSTRTVDLTTGKTGGGASQPAIPAGARAAVITLTVTQTTDVGFLTAYSASLTSVPLTSTINWPMSNFDAATTTTVGVDATGHIKITSGPRGTQFIVDVIGYYM